MPTGGLGALAAGPSGFDLSSLLGGLGFTGTSNLGSLLGGVTGSTNPLYDVMALLSFINQGQVTAEQASFMKNVLDQESSALGTAMNPNKLSAYRTALTPQGETAGQYGANARALTPQGWSPQQYANIEGQLTQPLNQALITNTLNPVNAQLAASGQNESDPTRQYISQQALAPYYQQEQQMGQAGANTLLNQLLSQQGMGQSAASNLLNQLLAQQQMGINQTQFGLSLPASTQYGLPNFSVGGGTFGDLSSLLGGNNALSQLLGGGGGFSSTGVTVP